MKSEMIKPHIVLLDAGALNFGDLKLEAFSRIGHFKSYQNSKYSQIASRIKGAHIVITNKCCFDQAILMQAEKLKCLCIAATGTNNVDLRAAKESGVAVCNVAGYSTDSVVQWTFLMMLALETGFESLRAKMKKGVWLRSPFFALTTHIYGELSGKVLGIIGYGAIGRRVAKVAQILGMKVMIAAIPKRKYSHQERKKRTLFHRVIQNADYLSIHAPLTPVTKNLIDHKVIRRMKPNACIINMARGGIVNEVALKQALHSGRLRAAASDVLLQEPPSKNHPLLREPKMLLTPHIAWASQPARKRLIHEVELNIKAYLRGQKRNRIV